MSAPHFPPSDDGGEQVKVSDAEAVTWFGELTARLDCGDIELVRNGSVITMPPDEARWLVTALAALLSASR